MSGNARDRRRRRREASRQWNDQSGRFNEGDPARIKVANYGQRYKGSKVTVAGKSEKAGFWVVQSSKRKSPLLVADEHLSWGHSVLAPAA